MWRTPLLVVLAAAAACAGDAAGPAPAAVDVDALTAAGARAAFESGTIPDGGPVARVTIGAIGLDVLARQGGDDVGAVHHVAASALPCGPGVSVFAAGAAFADLRSTPEGTDVDVQTPVGSCRYRVTQVASIDEAELGAVDGSSGDAVVLTTPHRSEDGLLDVVVAELDEASTTTTAAPTATTAPVVQVPQPSGRAAIDGLLGAWRAGDRGFALAVADPGAVEQLFAVPVSAAQDRGCTQGDANAAVQCVFRLGDRSELQVRAVPREGGFVVDLVTRSDP